MIMLREGGDLGFLGYYVKNPSVVIEACFTWDPALKVLGDTPLMSILIMGGKKKTIFEFFNGATVKMPTREDAEAYVLPLVRAFTDYRPERFR